MIELKPCHAPHWVHGAYQRNPRLYSVWASMIHRCENPQRKNIKIMGREELQSAKNGMSQMLLWIGRKTTAMQKVCS